VFDIQNQEVDGKGKEKANIAFTSPNYPPILYVYMHLYNVICS